MPQQPQMDPILAQLLAVLEQQGQLGQQGRQIQPSAAEQGLQLPRFPGGSQRLAASNVQQFAPQSAGIPFHFTGGNPLEPNAGAQQTLAIADMVLNIGQAMRQAKEQKEEKKRQGQTSGST